MASLTDVQQAVAKPPYPPSRRGLRFWLVQYAGLTRVMLTEYRNTAWLHIMFGFLMPLGMLFFLKYAVGDVSPERAIFLVGGNLTTSVVYGPTMLIINKIGWGRHTRDFDYWAALPLPKLALVLAMVTVALILAVPGLVILWLAGSLMLGLPLTGGAALLPLIPLGALSLVGLGAFLGTYAKDGQTANQLANLMMAFVTFLSPTMIPLEAMPAPLRVVAPFTPITYVSDAFRAALAGNFGPSFAYDVAIMTLFGLGMLTLAHFKLDWRSQ